MGNSLNFLDRFLNMGVNPSVEYNADIVSVNSAQSQGIATAKTPATAYKIANGTGTLVSGTVVVATGLATVASFVASMIGTGATATGATEAERIVVVSITTGAVTVNGSYHSATAAVMVQSVSGTAAFHWIAIGT